MSDSIRRLYDDVRTARRSGSPSGRTERLFTKGRGYISKKLAEEAVEVALEAVSDDRAATVRESADLLYNLVVLWAEMGIKPEDVWAEMRKREALLGMAEKMPKRAPRKNKGRVRSPDLEESALQPSL